MNVSNISHQLTCQSRDKNAVSENVTLACDDSLSGVSEKTMNGSGSFKGAEESFCRGYQSALPGHGRLKSGCGPGSPEEEENIKSKLRFFFLNPVEKYHATRNLPWKLCMQILKVFLVTVQLWIFADYHFAHVNYNTHQQLTLEHIFIRNWDIGREVYAFPPSTGKLAVYRKKEFFNFMDYTIHGWADIETDALGPFFKNSWLTFCVQHYKAGYITKDLTITMDSHLVEHCIHLKEDQLKTFNNSKEWMHQNNLTMPWHAVEKLNINFSLTSVNLRPLGHFAQPDCFQFNINIRFDNKNHDGQIPFHLYMKPVRLHCPTQTELTSPYSRFFVVLNLVVIILCLSSLLLCLRALMRAQSLKHKAGVFLSRNYNWNLTLSERMKFLNLWYVMISTNDCLIIIGSIINGLIETTAIVEDMWNICSLLLGTGNLLVWSGILRYLGFFKNYNVIILTMKEAAPNMFRYLSCVFFIFLGYSFSGWLILGPYHLKFSTLMSTFETLFSLINGDDMFPTFITMPMEKCLSVWVYSKFYLYSFVCLFIYVVLTLFVFVIVDTYKISKKCSNNGFPPTRMEKFYFSSLFDFSSGLYSEEGALVRVWRTIRRTWSHWRRAGYQQID